MKFNTDDQYSVEVIKTELAALTRSWLILKEEIEDLGKRIKKLNEKLEKMG